MSSLGSEVLNGVCLVSADPIQRFGQHDVEYPAWSVWMPGRRVILAPEISAFV
jgi:hypothetical protein